MEFIPSSKIYLLNAPLDSKYRDTLYFDTEPEQYAYFSKRVKKIFNNQSYQRVFKNTLNLQINAEECYAYNYLMFANPYNGGEKWFYAFITSMEYLNEQTTKIEYEIDVMQTWHFDYNLNQCFVEREHSLKDDIGDNTVEENLDIGEYYLGSEYDITELNQLSIVVAAPFDKAYTDQYGAFYSGVFQGVIFNAFPNTTDGALDAAKFIAGAGAKSASIVAVFLLPTFFAVGGAAKNFSHNIPIEYNIRRTSGAPPRNNKLYTYPYTFLYASNRLGNSANYRYEYFSKSSTELNRVSFIFYGDMSCDSTIVMVPASYKGVDKNFDEQLALSSFPQLAYTTDSFKAWLAQSAGNAPVSAISSVLSGAMGGNIMGGLASGVMDLAQVPIANAVHGLLQQTAPTLTMPNQAHVPTGSTIRAAFSWTDFFICNKHIRPEFVDVVDDYFNAYGYATHRIKYPNRKVRKRWTYTKTVGCSLTGALPAEDSKRICDIFDSGVRFWVPSALIGYMDIDNPPLGE